MHKEGQGQSPGQTPAPPCPGENALQDFQGLMQKIAGRPEVLLVGETLGGKDIHSLMGSFVKDLFATTGHPVPPGEVLKDQCKPVCYPGGKTCQLVFFLCRAACLKGKQAELRNVLKEVKQLVQKSPCALVGIIMEPQKGEEVQARCQLEKLIRTVFPKAPQQKRGRQTVLKGEPGKDLELEEVEVEVEIYIPGQPTGKMAIMKAACRASSALSKSGGAPSTGRAIEQGSKGLDPASKGNVGGSSWRSVALKGLLGTIFVASLASAGWYLYDQDMIPANIIPPNFFPFA